MTERDPSPDEKTPTPLAGKGARYAYLVLAVVLVAWFFFGRDWFIELGAIAAAGYIGWRRPDEITLAKETGFMAVAGIAVGLLIYSGWSESWYRFASSIAWSGIGFALGTFLRRSNARGLRWLESLNRPSEGTRSTSFRERFDAELDQQKRDP